MTHPYKKVQGQESNLFQSSLEPNYEQRENMSLN